MTMIMVLGDTHGNIDAASGAVFRAQAKDIKTIVQVGDFGYWEHYDHGAFLDQLSSACKRAGVNFFWIDGNHDNHPMLWKKYTEKTKDGFIKVREHLFYIPRGHVWEWDGLKMMGVGGAYSIDKDWRIQKQGGHDTEQLWWSTEMLTEEEIEFAKSRGKVDILFTHDCPTSFENHAPWMHKSDFNSSWHRRQMNEIGTTAQPAYWFHGHMHHFVRYDHRTGGDSYAKVIGLACDGMKNNYVLFDTETLKV